MHAPPAAAGRLDPAAGVMAQFVRLTGASDSIADADRMLAVVHHLAVDGVSWRALVPASVRDRSRADVRRIRLITLLIGAAAHWPRGTARLYARGQATRRLNRP